MPIAEVLAVTGDLRGIRSVAAKRRIIIVFFLMLLGECVLSGGMVRGATDCPTFGSPAAGTGVATTLMKVTFSAGLLSLDVREAEIGEVLRNIADKTGVSLAVGEGVAGRISLRLEGVTLEEALRRLAASRAILYEYEPAKKALRIIGAGAFAALDGPATHRGPADMTPISFSPLAEAPATGDVLPQGATPHQADADERLYDSQGRLLYKPGELLVQFLPEATAKQITTLHQSLGSIVLKRIEHLNIDRVRLRKGLSWKEGIAIYQTSAIVASVERHALRYPMLTPNDRKYASQWALRKIAVESAWDITQGKAEIIVAVIDTGIDLSHPDLAGNIWRNPDEISDNALDDDRNGYIDDVHGWDFSGVSGNNGDNDPTDKDGHGTHVAGIIAAIGNNGIGVAGIGWNLRVMPLKVQADGQQDMLLVDIIEAIDYAIARGVRIVNCSFGGEAQSDTGLEYLAFDRLRRAGILAVCAAGNTGIDNDTNSKRIYPASHNLDNIISVAASNSDDELANSNFGKMTVDLMAPGAQIISTTLCPQTGTCDSYTNKSGTSLAAPHVSGVAGLILSRNPALRYSRVKSLIRETVDRIPAVAARLASGGRLNAAAALGLVCLPGDVLADGRIGLDDVILALRIASGLDAGASCCQTADVNGDDQIGLAEAIYGLHILSGVH